MRRIVICLLDFTPDHVCMPVKPPPREETIPADTLLQRLVHAVHVSHHEQVQGPPHAVQEREEVGLPRPRRTGRRSYAAVVRVELPQPRLPSREAVPPGAPVKRQSYFAQSRHPPAAVLLSGDPITGRCRVRCVGWISAYP